MAVDLVIEIKNVFTKLHAFITSLCPEFLALKRALESFMTVIEALQMAAHLSSENAMERKGKDSIMLTLRKLD